jgi:hypothetical protein
VVALDDTPCYASSLLCEIVDEPGAGGHDPVCAADSDAAVAVALIWLTHIGVDRGVGYGLE